jgi:hypothetical protein
VNMKLNFGIVRGHRTNLAHASCRRAACVDDVRLRQRSGMSPEEVMLDLAGTDESSLACRSLPRTDP